MQNNQFELAIAIPRDGKSIKIREYGRNNITFVEGKRGQPYSIQIRNSTPNRVMAIVSVDGLDVVDGKPATAESRGYIIEGYASAEIKGWRTSTSEVRQFFFDDKTNSYSAGTTGETTNCGVIAVKIFAEKFRPLPQPQPRPPFTPPAVIREDHHHHHYYHRDYLYDVLRTATCGDGTCTVNSNKPASAGGLMCADSFSSAAPCCASTTEVTPEFNMGTGWGAAMTDCVNLTSFEKSFEMASLALYYTNADALKQMGIVMDKETAVTSLPQGFGGFCQPPKKVN